MAADVALSAEAIGHVVSFVAPGYFAQIAYRARLPGKPDTDAQKLLVVSVATSLPLVAIANIVARRFAIDQKPTAFAYLACLLLPSLVAGYLLATLRTWERSRRLVRRLGFVQAPEATVYARTFTKLRSDEAVTIQFTDRRKVSGTPRLYPLNADSDADLYLTNAVWWNKDLACWDETPARRGLIVRLAEVQTIAFGRNLL